MGPCESEQPMTQHRTHPSRADFRFWWPITVRWGDMDAMGHVNNSTYFQYLGSARIGFMEALGWGLRTKRWCPRPTDRGWEQRGGLVGL